MADKKISELDEVFSPESGDFLVIVDSESSVTKKIDANQIIKVEESSLPQRFEKIKDFSSISGELFTLSGNNLTIPEPGGYQTNTLMAITVDDSIFTQENQKVTIDLPNSSTSITLGAGDLDDVYEINQFPIEFVSGEGQKIALLTSGDAIEAGSANGIHAVNISNLIVKFETKITGSNFNFIEQVTGLVSKSFARQTTIDHIFVGD